MENQRNPYIIELEPTAPFHFDSTLHKPDHFPSADNAWEPGVRWQTMRWQGLPLGLKFENRSTVDKPVIRLSVWTEESLDAAFLDGLATEIVYRCNLNLDLRDFYARFADDTQLGPVIARWRGMRPAAFASLYEYLLIAIVLQNATVRRSVQMMQVLLLLDARFGEWKMLAVHYLWEDLFWQRVHQPVDWLEALIRL